MSCDQNIQFIRGINKAQSNNISDELRKIQRENRYTIDNQ